MKEKDEGDRDGGTKIDLAERTERVKNMHVFG
jgi:hypothetical protein